MATKTTNKNMAIDYKALYEEQVWINDSLQKLYRIAEDKLATLQKSETITPKDVRVWCRKKYGKDWWKENKDERKKEAQNSLNIEE